MDCQFYLGIADDVLRDVYVRGKYRDVILPMTVIRRLDALLEPTKKAVVEMKDRLDQAGVTNQDPALRMRDSANVQTPDDNMLSLKHAARPWPAPMLPSPGMPRLSAAIWARGMFLTRHSASMPSPMRIRRSRTTRPWWRRYAPDCWRLSSRRNSDHASA